MTGDGENFGGPEPSELEIDGAEAVSSIEEIDAMLEEIDGAIEQASAKVESGRVYDADNENVRIQWIRALGYLLRTKRQILDDRDRAAMIEEIREINEREARGQYR